MGNQNSSQNDHQNRQKSMEDRLFRLMPATMSHAAQQRLEDTIDDLTGVDANAATHEVSPSHKQKIWAVAAAVAVSLVTAFTFSNKSNKNDVVSTDTEEISSLVLINSSNIVDGREDDGLVFSHDGSLAQYRYRYAIRNEQQLLDTETGMVVTISESSHEVVTVPKQFY